MTEHLQRARYEPLGDRGNYRNGYRPRRLNLYGLGQVQLYVAMTMAHNCSRFQLLSLAGP